MSIIIICMMNKSFFWDYGYTKDSYTYLIYSLKLSKYNISHDRILIYLPARTIIITLD